MSMTVKNNAWVMMLVLMCALIPGTRAFADTDSGAKYSDRGDVKQFIDEMVKEYGFARDYLEDKFNTAKRLDNVLELIARPAEKELTWKQYRPIFVTSKRSQRGKDFMEKYREPLARAEQEYGVPAEIITAIIGVETYYGRLTGKYSVFDSLTTLSFDYPPRSNFFRRELKQFLLLSREEDIDFNDMTGSYAGAMGMPQFIPSSYRRYAVDFDGDGKKDLWHSVPDVIGSVANYFSMHGWQKGELVTLPVNVKDKTILNEKNTLMPYATVGQFKRQHVSLKPGARDLPRDEQLATLLTFDGADGEEHWIGLKNFYVITRYNRSEMYAMAVYQLSEDLKN
jgi:membrane-bound lytic murein transglycosylase B